VRDGVEDAGGEAAGAEAVGDGPGAAGGEFGGFEERGVARGQGKDDGAHAEDVGCVPG